MHSSHVKTQSCISVSTTACCYNLPHSDCYFSSVLSCTFLISYTTSGHLYFYNNPVHILTYFQYILNPFISFYSSCLVGLNWTSATQLYHTLMKVAQFLLTPSERWFLLLQVYYWGCGCDSNILRESNIPSTISTHSTKAVVSNIWPGGRETALVAVKKVQGGHR